MPYKHCLCINPHPPPPMLFLIMKSSWFTEETSYTESLRPLQTSVLFVQCLPPQVSWVKVKVKDGQPQNDAHITANTTNQRQGFRTHLSTTYLGYCIFLLILIIFKWLIFTITNVLIAIVCACSWKTSCCRGPCDLNKIRKMFSAVDRTDCSVWATSPRVSLHERKMSLLKYLIT